MLNATDKFLVNDSSITETVTWSEIKGGINPLVVSVVIVPNEPVVNFEVTATPVMTGGEEPYTVDSYQWHTSDDAVGTNQVDIPGATESTYTPVSADANKFLGCTVTATDANGVSVEGTGYATLPTDMGLVLATPSVLTPPDGAGIGGTIQYTPETSDATAVDIISGDFTKLTLTNDISYNAETGDEVDTIDNAFKAGTKVTGNGDATVFTDSSAFSTTTYSGNATTDRFIETGIDNTNKSMLWFKARNTNMNHALNDTFMGPQNHLVTNEAFGIQGHSQSVQSYQNNGVTIGSYGYLNGSYDYVVWNFRGAPGFFDVVTYDGTTGVKTVPHSLGSEPGCVIVKATTRNDGIDHNWSVYHKDLDASNPEHYWIGLNMNNGRLDAKGFTWNDTKPTAQEFSVGPNDINVNKDGEEFVAYLFADTPGLIKCGKYQGAASGGTVTEACGFKPGWLMVKQINGANDWVIIDNNRGGDRKLMPNDSAQEKANTSLVTFTDSGFTVAWGDGSLNGAASYSYIYVAIAENASAGEFMPTGVLTEDADPSDPSITLTDVTGTWVPGFSAIADEQVNKEPPGWIPGEEFNYHPTTSDISNVITDTAAVTINQDGTTYTDYGLYLDDATFTEDRPNYTDLMLAQSYFNSDLMDGNKIGNAGLYIFEQTARFEYSGLAPGATIDIIFGTGSIGQDGYRFSGDIESIPDQFLPDQGAYGTNTLPKTLQTVTVTASSGTFYLQATTEANPNTGTNSSLFIHWIQYLGGSPTTLTFDDNKVYKEDGTEIQLATIDQKFKAGDTIKGDSAGAGVPNTAAFTTTLDSGNNVPKSVTTNVNNTSKALVWQKNRAVGDHILYDTERGPKFRIKIHQTDVQQEITNGSGLNEFTSTGYDTGAGNSQENKSGDNYAIWNFRAAPGFFDIVTWENDGTNPGPIPHSLGSEPAFIFSKNLDASTQWYSYHKETGVDKYLLLNDNWAASNTNPTSWEVTSNTFTPATELIYPGNMVSYMFADTPGLVKCGSYMGDGSTSGNDVDCGFEPGWLMIKNVSSSADWIIQDLKRAETQVLRANLSDAEVGDHYVVMNNTGFYPRRAVSNCNAAGQKYIYVAIAEDAMAGALPPTGTLTADADKDSKTMTLTDVSGTWAPGIKAINNKELTGETPTVADIEFTSTQPATESGEVTTWGSADWQVARDSSFSVGLQETSVQLADTNPEQGPDASVFNLTENTEYFVRTKYNSLDPTEVSEWSSANHFLMGGYPKTGAYGSFTTTLYTGNGTNQSISTGIDNTNNSLIWLKSRTNNRNHHFFDTERGIGLYLNSNLTNVQTEATNSLTSFDSDGFTLGGTPFTNALNENFVAWNFAAAEGFFDVVTFDGDSNPNTVVPHSLNAEPGFIILKRTEPNAASWICYHKELGSSKALTLDTYNEAFDDANSFTADPTSTGFNPGGAIGYANELGSYYVAYLFADNPDGGIKCGAGNGAPATIDCGFKPGWVLLKSTSGVSSWYIFDSKRGNMSLSAEVDSLEQGPKDFTFTDTGFTQNVMSGDFIYVAIADDTVTFFDAEAGETITNHTIVKRYGKDPSKLNLKQYGIYELTEQPIYSVDAYVPENGKYKPVRSYLPELNRANNRIAEIKQAFNDRLNNLEVAAASATEPFDLNGYYPLYYTEAAADAASVSGTSHCHTIDGTEYFMPDGGTIYHGTYGDSSY